MRRALLPLISFALLALTAPSQAWAHAALLSANPAPGASLKRPPAAVRLGFSEEIEPSVSEIHVLDAKGARLETPVARGAGASGLSLQLSEGDLGRGTYTVDWRVVSADDGHSTAGSYRFGVETTPSGVVESTSTPGTSGLEIVARFVFIAGLFALLGAAVASLAGFGGPGRSGLGLGAGGWVAAAAGLALLAEAQKRTAGSSFTRYFHTTAGHALIWRAVALVLAGAALAIAWRRPGARRAAMAVVVLAVIATIAIHVGNGHAASGPWAPALTVSAQVAHFTAAGLWFGGLAALLLGLRASAPEARGAALRRFGPLAAIAVVVVIATGTLRAIDELTSFGQLTSSGYGRAIAAKVVLIALIIWLAFRNRRRARSAALGLRPFTRGASLELGLAATAVAVAALLGTSAPPTVAQPAPARGLTAEASTPGEAIQVELTTSAARPGPNRFAAQISGPDSSAVDGVRLRFDPLDDPMVKPTTLSLRLAGDGDYEGSGPNLRFDGRWKVTAIVALPDRVTRVPLELDVPGPENFVSVQHIPGQPAKYTMQIGSVGSIRLIPSPQRAGPAMIHVSCYTAFGGVSDVATMVVTVAGPDTPAGRVPVTRLTKGRFVARADLPAGADTVAVTAHTRDGTRLRGEFQLQIPG